MTYTKLPGISYTETVATTPVAAEEGNIPLFIIDHPTDTINGFDDTICHFDNYDAFATLTADNGLTVTKTYIQDTLMEYGATEFYTYSIESSTAAGYTKVIEDTAHLDDVKNMIYIEEKVKRLVTYRRVKEESSNVT